MKAILFLLTASLLIVSCHHNRMKTDEKTLKKEILTEEQQRAREDSLRAEREKQLADSIAQLPKSYRFREDRSIDPQHPPMVIDLIGNRTNPQKIKLSQLFSKIEYIRLEPLPDSSFYQGRTGFLVSKNFLYGFSAKGIVQYDHAGKFLKYICKNEYHYTLANGYEMVMEEDWNRFRGGTQPKLLNGKLYYKYEDRPAGTACLMEYDEQPGDLSLPLPAQENQNHGINGLGVQVTKLKARKNIMDRTMFAPLGNLFFGKFSIGKSVRGGEKNFLTVIGHSGDTICAFEDKDPIRNFTKSVYRGVDDGNSYYQDGTLYIRQAFNDTIFRLVLPNRLVPAYILDFGSLGIRSSNEGIDPGVSLKDKLILQSFLETNRYLFIAYSKDYDCPNTAKSGTLKYSRLIYDKKSKSYILLYADEAPVTSEGKMSWPSAPEINIGNDLDDFPFLWPDQVTSEGLPFISFTPKRLAERLKNDQYLHFREMEPDDQVIAIYK